MNLNKLKEKLIKEDKEFKKEYFKEDLAFGISRLVSNVRAYEEVDQTKLAKLLKTKQSGISRLERGNTLPSLTFINKIAKSLNYRIKINFISNKTGAIFDSDGTVLLNNYNLNPGITIQVKNNSNYQTVAEEIKSPYCRVELLKTC